MQYTAKKVLVTGADGFIGSHLVDALARQDAEVTALSLYNSFDMHGWLDDLPPARQSGVKHVRGDVRDAAFIRRIVAGQEIVFHLAALIAIPYSYSAPQSYVETNINGTLNVLEACRDAGVERVVHTSTSEVYGSAMTLPIDESHPLQGQSPYSASKIGADMMAEAYFRSFELPVVILRPFNTYGPRQSERAVIGSTIRQILDPGCTTLKIGAVDTVRDFTFVEDTVAAFLAAAVSKKIACGTPYNAGSGKSVTIGELIELLRDITGCAKPIEQDLLRLRPSNSEVMALLANSGKFTRDTGWRPRVGLREGLSRTMAWWRKRLEQGHIRESAAFMA